MILLSELSRRRIRSISKLIKVGRQEPVMVLRVDKEKGYIDLSKRRVAQEDVAECEERFNKSKMVHSIMRHTCETLSLDILQLYQEVGWPLYKKYGHAFEAFKIIVKEPDAVLSQLTKEVEVEKEDGSGEKETRSVAVMTPELQEQLVKNIRRRMTPQPLKLRADVEMTCFTYDGVLQIKEAMRAAEAQGVEDVQIKMKLIAAPLYVLTTQTLNKNQGIELLTKAIEAATEIIQQKKGKCVVKEAPRAVSERDERMLQDKMDALNKAEDGDGEEDNDETMGDVDIEAAPALQMDA